MKRCRWLPEAARLVSVLLVVACAVVNEGAAQSLIVVRNVNLRRDPSTGLAPIRTLRPPEELELLEPATSNNYYHVFLAESEEEGWVWANNVRLQTDVSTGPLLVASIDPGWPKPVPVTGTFVSPVRDTTCGPVGDGGDTATNRLKNRTDVPMAYRAVAFAAIYTLASPSVSATSRLNWPAESLAVVLRYEGVPVQVAGYLVAVKPQSGGSGETTNCHLTRSAEVDWHLALVEEPGQGEADAIVVETTPRIRVNHPKWTTGRLNPWLDSVNPVRISGWLLFDPAHPAHLGRFRGTLWEVHPITRIEVWMNDAWVDVDDLP